MTEFSVRIIKKGAKSGLLLDASSMDTSFEFNTIQFHEDVNSLYNDYINQKTVDIYTGPAFNSLDERLQSELTDFLTSIGINEDLMAFMNVMSVDKDQRLYLKWLKNVQNFLS